MERETEKSPSKSINLFVCRKLARNLLSRFGIADRSRESENHSNASYSEDSRRFSEENDGEDTLNTEVAQTGIDLLIASISRAVEADASPAYIEEARRSGYAMVVITDEQEISMQPLEKSKGSPKDY